MTPRANQLPEHVLAAVAAATKAMRPQKPPPRPIARRKPKCTTGLYGSVLEEEYAAVLTLRQAAGEIAEWRYQPEKLRLADGAWYTPDFRVLLPNGEVEFHETKGWMREAARVRLLVAAELHPYRFLLVKREGGAWAVSAVGAV